MSADLDREGLAFKVFPYSPGKLAWSFNFEEEKIHFNFHLSHHPNYKHFFHSFCGQI